MTRRLPPTWLMGLANLPFSIASAVLLITVPQLLAARHVPEPAITSLVAFAEIPGFAVFLLSPILDVRFSRRTYAVVLAILSALFSFRALTSLADLGTLRWLLFLGTAASTLYQGALGGWLGSLVPADEEARLGAWFTVANIAGFGIDASLNIWLFRALPDPLGAAAIAGISLVPLAIFLVLPAPGPDRRLAEESFRAFFGDVAAMIRRPSVIRTLAVFALPAACFALTNVLGGIGTDFATSERMVGLVAGVGVTIAGVIGSLAVPALARRIDPYLLYLAIGLLGALFTLSLLPLARTPATFTLAMVGENIAQAAAFATANAIIFRAIGKDNPLAATEFTVLNSAVLLPLAYVQWADGQGYAAGGLDGALLTDAALGVFGCAVIALLLRLRRPGAVPA